MSKRQKNDHLSIKENPRSLQKEEDSNESSDVTLIQHFFSQETELAFEKDDEDTTLIREILTDDSPDKPKKDKIYLLVIAGAFTGQMYRIEGEKVSIGRSSSCDFTLRDDDISRVHVTIEVLADRRVILTDLGSTNGTFVNGKRSKRCGLFDGDRVQLGLSTIFKLSLHDELEERLQNKLYENAILDGLTQLHNRKYFDDQMKTEFSFAKRHKTALSLLLMDIDHFKRINDTYGHLHGDEVLRTISNVLKRTVRTEDYLARYGGEEFVILARGILPMQASILGERVREKIEHESIPLDHGKTIHVTVSIGVVTMYTLQYETADELVREADERLYAAKKSGRNKVVTERKGW